MAKLKVIIKGTQIPMLIENEIHKSKQVGNPMKISISFCNVQLKGKNNSKT